MRTANKYKCSSFCVCVSVCVYVCVTKELVVSLICIIDFGLYSTPLLYKTNSSRTHTEKSQDKQININFHIPFQESFNWFQCLHSSNFSVTFPVYYSVCVRLYDVYIIIICPYLYYFSPYIYILCESRSTFLCKTRLGFS